MLKYIGRRLLLTVPTLLLAFTMIFFMVHLIPGDPAELMLGDMATPAALQQIRTQLSLDKPLEVQFLTWLLHVAHGDLGMSIVRQQPVLQLVISSFGVTASLVLPAVALAALIAIPAGAAAGWKQNSTSDVMIVSAATLILSIPSFWLGLMFLLVFGVKLNLLPVVGYVSPLHDFWEGIRYLIMPVTCLALIEAGVMLRLLRSSVIQVSRLEYIAAARAKGLSESTVLRRHALPNAMGPTWTMLGLTLGSLLGGAVVTETVFSLPGLGRLLVESIFARDYPVIQGCMLVIAVCYVGANLLVEVTYPLLSPGLGHD